MQLSDLAEQLRILGLTEKQSKVFVANTFLGAAAAQAIAQQAGISRPTTYDVLEELIELGLITKSVRGAKTVFVAAGGAGLVDWLTRQSQELIMRQEALQQLLPSVREIERETGGVSPSIRYVHDKAGVDAIWPYVIRKAQVGTQVYSLTNHDQFEKSYPEYRSIDPKVRLSKRLATRQFYYNRRTEVPTEPMVLRETRRLTTPVPGDITLYDNTAVLLSYGEGDQGWSGIVIEDTNIVATLRRLFELAWRS